MKYKARLVALGYGQVAGVKVLNNCCGGEGYQCTIIISVIFYF